MKELHEIREARHWDANTVQNMCIEYNLYTCGCNEEYIPMLNMVQETEPTTLNIYKIAQDINAHSEGQTVTNIMYLLANHACYTCYTLVDEDGNEIEE